MYEMFPMVPVSVRSLTLRFPLLSSARQSGPGGEGGQALPGLCNQCRSLPGRPAVIPHYSQNVSNSLPVAAILRGDLDDMFIVNIFHSDGIFYFFFSFM